MAPPLRLNQLYNNKSYEVVSAHNMCLSARACYPYQYLPISDNSDSTLDLPFPEETRDRKKLKRSISIAGSMDSYSSQYSDGINFCTYNSPSISRTGSLITCRSCSFVIIYGLIIKDTLQLRLLKRRQKPSSMLKKVILKKMRVLMV